MGNGLLVQKNSNFIRSDQMLHIIIQMPITIYYYILATVVGGTVFPATVFIIKLLLGDFPTIVR